MINVSIIGFGGVGSTLAVLLLNNSVNMTINIVEPSSDKAGAILDMAHSMSLYPTKELHLNDDALFKNADFVFYSAGIPNGHGESRFSKSTQNIELSRSIFEGVKFTKTPYIIIITNPVDIIPYHVQKYTGLPFNKVIGVGTLLECVRLSHYLSELSGYSHKAINAFVLGEHGETQVPAYSITTVNGTLISSLPQFNVEVLQNAAEKTKNAAFEIRKTEPGTKYAVTKCAESIMNFLLSDEVTTIPLSVRTNDFYNKLLGIKKSIYISIPVNISSKGIEINQSIVLKDEEIIALSLSAKAIEAQLLLS